MEKHIDVEVVDVSIDIRLLSVSTDCATIEVTLNLGESAKHFFADQTFCKGDTLTLDDLRLLVEVKDDGT